MQRVSAFLPSWDKRNSNTAAANNANGTASASGNGRATSFFGWSHRSTPSNTTNIASKIANRSSSAPTTSALARINVAAANSDRVQREAYWPATLDLECDKAARILKSFCSDGYLAPVDSDVRSVSSAEEPNSPAKITKKIPKRIIQNAAGIAVFTCMRNGLWMTGSGGSGILIARKSDGTWSPPSGIMLHTPTLSFIIGVDVYDCVLVVNNLAALESITRPRVTLGEDVGLRSGPSALMDTDEVDVNWRDLGNTVLTYMKSRGQHQAVNLSGCILTERANENERFYSSNVTQMDILAGNVARNVDETRALFEVIKMAEGRTDFDREVIDRTAVQPAPGDAMIATPRSIHATPLPAFGIPKADDPDPFGVLALEMAGLEIREAGTALRPASSQFDTTQHPLSPSFSKFSRQSMDTFVTRSNRGSYMSTRTAKSQVTDVGTQTSTGNTPETTPSPGQSDDGQERGSIEHVLEEVKEDDEEIDYTTIDLTALKHLSQDHGINLLPLRDIAVATRRDPSMLTPATVNIDRTSKASSNYENDGLEDEDDDDELDRDNTDDEEDEDEDEDDEEEPVIFEVAAVQPARTQVMASRMIHARGNVVTIAKRIPPPLPRRSPARNSRTIKSDVGGELAALRSPLRQAFSEADLRADENKEQDKEQLLVEATPVDALGVGVQTAIHVAEETQVEETKVEEVKIEEPQIEQPKTEESKVEEPETPEPTTEEPNTEEPMTEELKTEEIETEQLEVKALEVDESELKAEEPKMEEHTEKIAVAEPQVAALAEEPVIIQEATVDEPISHEEPVEQLVLETADTKVNENEDTEMTPTADKPLTEASSVADAKIEDVATEQLEADKADITSQQPDHSPTESHDEDNKRDSSATETGHTHTETALESELMKAESHPAVSEQLESDELTTKEAEPIELVRETSTTNGAELPHQTEAIAKTETDGASKENVSAELGDISATGLDTETGEETTLQPSNDEQTDGSGLTATHKKHTSSILTGATEDRWSFDGSSVTTSTSERTFAMADDAVEECTPTKPAKEVKIVETDKVDSPIKSSTEATHTHTHTVTVA